MSGTSFKIEDLELYIPSSEKDGSKIVTSKPYSYTKVGHHSKKGKTYQCFLSNDVTLRQLEEMTANPYFAAVPVYDLESRINTGFIESYSRKWLHGISTIDLNITQGYGKFLFLVEDIERPLHDRWKYTIQEDFSTDAAWPGNGVVVSTPLNSIGYGKQVQDIPWNEEVGGFTGSNALELVGDISIYSTSNASEDLMAAGWDWWENYEVSCWCYTNDVATDDFGIVFRYVEGQHYLFEKSGTATLSLKKDDGGYTTIITTTHSATIAHQTYHHMKVIVQGNRIRCYYNGEEIFDKIDTDYVSGRVGIRSNEYAVYFDDFRCTLLPPTNFNLPASTDWTNQYSVGDIETAHGTQKKLIAPDQNIQFKQSKAGDDCILYLPMNEGQGTPKDHSKNNNEVTLKLSPEWVNDDEKGWCMEFDDVTDEMVYVDLPNNSPEYHTIDFWAKSASIEYSYILHCENFQPLFYHQDATYSNKWYYDGSTYFTGNEMIVDTWHRITLISDSVNDWAYCFIDGKLVGIITYAGVDTLGDDYLAIGNSYAGDKPWKGRFMGLRIFDSMRWDVAYGFDSTPATVFCWDDNRYDSDVDYPDDSDCVLLLHMDEGVGTDAGTTYDASGKGHDATITDITGWSDTSFRGEAGTCMDFELANTDYLTIADHADFSFAGDVPFSIEAWVKFETVTIEATIIAKYNNSNGNREWQFKLDATNVLELNLYDQNSSSNLIRANSSTAIVANIWYHVVTTYDGSESETGINIYVNGVDDTGTQTEGGTYPGMTATAQDVCIGRRNAADYFDGLIDEVRIHRRELSANEVAARYRSEPYLHDHYQMTRVYNKTHPFKGLPVISNGLIRLSFPDYDLYDERNYNILIPLLYAWYENSWHLIGRPDIRYKICGTEDLLSDATGKTEFELLELTDQYCKLRINYSNMDSTNMVDGYNFYIDYIIRNGYPGIWYELEETDYIKDEYTALKLNTKFNVGTGINNRFWFGPEDNIKDTLVELGGNEWISELDDNWAIMFSNTDESDAPSKNVIMGLCVNSKYTDLGSALNRWLATSSDNDWWNEITAYAQQAGSIFFVPYDVDLLFQEADSDDADVLTDGANDQVALAGYSGDGYIHLEDAGASEYAEWHVGTLAKGSYMAIARIASSQATAGKRDGNMYVDNDGDQDGDLASDLAFQLAVVNTWYYRTLPFHTDGTNDVYISITSDAANDVILVDSFYCIPLANGEGTYPSNLAHMAFCESNIIRGLKK